MTSRNLEAARRGMSGADEFIALLDDQVVFDQRSFPLPDSLPVFTGKAEVVEMLRRYWGTFDEYRMTPSDFIDAGQGVIVIIQEHGRGKGSGVRLDREWAQIWTFSRGRIVRVEPHRTRAEALEAAGIAG